MLPVLLSALAAAAAPPPPELPLSVYKERRERVMKELGNCHGLLGAQGKSSNDSVRPAYHQDGDFYWLTGIEEPETFIAFMPTRKYGKVVLWLKGRDPEAEQWTGPRDPISNALKAKYGVDAILRGKPRGLALIDPGTDCIALIAPATVEERPDLKLSRQLASELGIKVVQKRDLLARLRSAHDAEELRRIEHAIAITRLGHEAAVRAAVPGATEKAVQLAIEAAFTGGGATGLSYATIVGSGPNANIFHWTRNNRTIREGDLVLVDAGAEYGHYASDVTRTFPAGGRFTAEQAKLYRAVYQAQEEAFRATRPGVSMAELDHVMEESLRRSGYSEHAFPGAHFVGRQLFWR